MEQQQPEEKKKGKFWKTLLKVVTLGFIVAKAAADAGQINGTGGAILRKIDSNDIEKQQ